MAYRAVLRFVVIDGDDKHIVAADAHAVDFRSGRRCAILAMGAGAFRRVRARGFFRRCLGCVAHVRILAYTA
jgi:hypothetical protein